MPEAPIYHNALPLASMLLEYRLESVLGAGGYGITYLGWDTNLEKHVAIKEYLPAALAIRALDGSVLPVNTENEYNYKWGLDRFIQEARTLAKFTHPNIVRVYRYFEGNGTSYMVMDYEAGESLNQYLRCATMPDEAKLKGILMPVVDGLQAVHKAGFLHRDIKPSNVFIRENGNPVLLDFGSARPTSSGKAEIRTAIVSPGYAPLEQYSNTGHQGPWSDIYALSAVMYRAVTGENPSDAVTRMKADDVPQALAAARAHYSERFLKAIEWGMTVDEKMRPQNVADWRDLFLGRAPLTALSRGSSAGALRTLAAAAAAPVSVHASDPKARAAKPAVTRRPASVETPSVRKGRWIIAGGIAIIGLTMVALTVRHQPAPEASSVPPAQSPTPAEPQATPATVPGSESGATLPAQAQPTVSQAEPAAGGAVLQPAPATTVPITVPVPEPSVDVRRNVAEAQRAPATASASDTQSPLAVKKEFEMADRDANSYLTPDEVRGKFPYIEQHFSQVDADRDGRISAAEFMQLRKKQQGTKFSR